MTISLEMVTFLLVSILSVVALVRAVSRGLVVESSIAWVLAIVAFPGIGAILFILLATPAVGHTRRLKVSRREAARGSFDGHQPGVPLTPDPHGIASLAARVTGLHTMPGNEVLLMVEDLQAFEAIESALESAEKTIWSEYYLVRNDETGRRFLDCLARKARQGVEVRLIYDAVGSRGIDPERLKSIEDAGGFVSAFLPLNPFSRRWSLHLRNHRKLVIIDGQTAFTGGMNVGDEYSGRGRASGRLHYRDTHLELRGPAVADLEQVFVEDWAFATDEIVEIRHALPAPRGAADVTIIPSGPDQAINASGMLYFALITAARQRVYLTCPYFLPDQSTVTALTSAALRGVDVRIMLPLKCDVPLVGPAARAYYASLVNAGVRIFEYRPSMHHAKTVAIDGTWAIVGSANVDFRSFRLNFELSALVRDPEFVGLLETAFLEDQVSSREISHEELHNLSLLDRILQGTARLLSPIL